MTSYNFDKALVNVTAFMDDKELTKIITCCGLEPLDDWHMWTDNAGNELHIKEDKSFQLKKAKVVNFKTYDIYYKAAPQKIANESKWALLAKGMKNGEECMFIWFISEDNKLRLLSFVNGHCKNKSPLASGINTLKYIIQNMSSSETQFAPINVIEPPTKCHIDMAISTAWPPTNDTDNSIVEILNNILSHFKSIEHE